jgi:hypothetical protein
MLDSLDAVTRFPDYDQVTLALQGIAQRLAHLRCIIGDQKAIGGRLAVHDRRI